MLLVEDNFIRGDGEYQQTIEKFQAKYGELPPTFIVLSPTQRCNLRCIGCYANSDAKQSATIKYSYVDKVLTRNPRLLGLQVRNHKRR